jgi:hypothetical protein
MVLVLFNTKSSYLLIDIKCVNNTTQVSKKLIYFSLEQSIEYVRQAKTGKIVRMRKGFEPTFLGDPLHPCVWQLEMQDRYSCGNNSTKKIFQT